MTPLLYSFLVLVLSVVAITVGCVMGQPAVVITGGMLFGHGFVKGALCDR